MAKDTTANLNVKLSVYGIEQLNTLESALKRVGGAAIRRHLDAQAKAMLGIEDATIYVDGKVLCERGPCLKGLQQGEHTITVSRPDFKSYTKTVKIQAKTETQIRITLAPQPGRGDAIITGILAAGFAGGGVFLGLQANKYRDDLRKEIDAGLVPPDSNDPRLLKGKIFAIAADATFAIAGITALTAIYYTFREKGAPSTGLIDVRALALRPEIGPGYAGLGMGVSW